MGAWRPSTLDMPRAPAMLAPMDIEVHGNPDYGHATLALGPDETVLVESGAMAWMDPGLDLRARVLGGLGKSLLRKLFGGESFLLGEYTAARAARLGISPTTPGTVLHRRLEGDGLWLTAGSYLASTPGLDLTTRFGGLRAIFSGEGLFFLHLAGRGELLFNAYGAVVEQEVSGELIVDTGHVVAFTDGLEYTVETLGGVKQTLFSGEGLVLRFRGSGTVWLQSRTLNATAGWITPYLRG